MGVWERGEDSVQYCGEAGGERKGVSAVRHGWEGRIGVRQGGEGRGGEGCSTVPHSALNLHPGHTHNWGTDAFGGAMEFSYRHTHRRS